MGLDGSGRIMISFSVSLVLLVLGYWIYGRYTEKVFGIDPDRTTPAYALRDNVDYVPLSGWRVFLCAWQERVIRQNDRRKMAAKAVTEEGTKGG